jgi:hypothetical protein
VAQVGWNICVKGCAGNVCLHKEHGEVEVLQPLPEHPNPKHLKACSDDTAFVLPSGVAELVLEKLELPTDADPCVIHVAEAFAIGGGSEPFVRVVWFTSHAVATATRRSSSQHEQNVSELYESWVAMKERNVGISGQPAAGKYVPLGVGVLTGSGRESLEIGDGRSVLPFPRNPVESDAFEDMLSDFISDVSAVVNHVLPYHVVASHAPLAKDARMVENAYQYPRLREDAGYFRSHQLVMRGPRHAGVDVTNAQLDRDAYMSVSDLHVDSWDGGGSLGACTVHTCRRAHLDDHTEVDEELLRCRGLAVFPRKWGGRGVHVVSMVPGWNCAIFMQTCERFHEAVLPTQCAKFGMPSLRMMRVVTYPLRRIERLLERLEEEPSKIDDVMQNSHGWVRKRMQ